MTPRVGKVEATRRAAKIGKILAVAFGLVGIVSMNMFLVAIAIFIYFSAGAEYRAVQFQDLFMKGFTSFGKSDRSTGRPGGNPRTATGYDSEPSFSASGTNTPEPEKDTEQARRIKSVFDDLYKDWH